MISIIYSRSLLLRKISLFFKTDVFFIPMDKKGITSFCENHKGKAKTLKRKFKSEKPEFQRVERAFGSSLEEGCRKILSYYKKQSIEERLPFKVDELFEEKYNSADKLLEYQFNFRGVLGKIKRTPEGIVIWDDYGPKGDI